MPDALSLDEALKQYDRAAQQAEIEIAERERQELVSRFPIDDWPKMTLDRYALGQENKRDVFCWWAEFGAPHVGSMKGGTAAKHIIYRKQDGSWYFDNQTYADEQEHWRAVRDGFVKAFAKASEGDWPAIDQIDAIRNAVVLRTKTLHCYFPNELLPISSLDHIRHFLALLGNPEASAHGNCVIRLNRALLQQVRSIPTIVQWSTQELARFLYDWAHPQDQRRIVKIAPGAGARFWPECLDGGFICVGWEPIGDLTQFENKDKYLPAYRSAYAAEGTNPSTISRQAKELWTLRELEPGDRVVANKGISHVLAVGEVVAPGYEYRPDRPQYKHVVHVKWDTSYARAITPQPRWGQCTIADVPQALAAEILARGNGDPKIVTVDPGLRDIAEALERKGQAILYGPPGTGKTYTARRFAAWWLTMKMGDKAPASLPGTEAFRQIEQRLSTTTERIAPLTWITFHPSYSYEDFVEGFRPVDNGAGTLALRLEDGIFKRVCREAEANPKQPFLMLIDEINRANVAKVFGELITLLEKDKRNMSVSLPQSKQAFAIPANVYILGTMNTADRSIKLLDAALRRRFAFLELMPDSGLLTGAKIGALALDDFLDKLNRRIAVKEGREKQIGHSFLLDGDDPVSQPEEFARRFCQEILPLLQEYCYEDYAILADYIGAKLVDRDGQVLNDELLSDPDSLIAALVEAFAGESSQ